MPLAFLARAGIDARGQDLAHEQLDEGAVRDASFVGISVPMHTALRLGVEVGQRVRALNPDCHLCFFGVYAPLNEGYLRSAGATSVLGGECEAALVDLVRGADTGGVQLDRLQFPQPARVSLPTLQHYAKLDVGDDQRLAGYTEASRGCKHGCRHCPLPAVYERRFFIVDRDVVLADVASLIEAGARHVTFGDPDFLNGPRHAIAIAREFHARWPDATFDATIKVSHLLDHADAAAELASLGCAFIVTAVESLNDRVLALLAKGHTRADVERVLDWAAARDVTLRPTFVPFTPWSTLDDIVELADTIDARDLRSAVDPVQLSIRLLVPPGSLLLDGDGSDAFGALDAEALTHTWTHADPRMDALQRELAALAEHRANFDTMRAAIYRAANRTAPPARPPSGKPPAPRLTEHWFC